ncbi:MAG: hypothetical protein R3300_00580 [Candidatus Promineifilaceae bacterium]|nr:hypothetical protein [Candidatus Promineifilaceae bacterium]
MSTDSPPSTQTEPFFQRHAWIVPAALSVIFLLFGIGDLMLGQDADPAIVESLTGIAWEELQATTPAPAYAIDLGVRAGGQQLIVIGILSLAIVLKAFRPGQRWAWWVMWIWPLWMAGIFLLLFTADRQPGWPAPPPLISSVVLFIFALLAQVLSYRKFFPAR